MRHRFHAICPYFAMFPEAFVQKFLVWSQRGDWVYDPFSGRGTTVFESLLNDRHAIGCDTNAVAVCISNAKADPPSLKDTLDRLREIEQKDPAVVNHSALENDFFQTCFHPETLIEILHLRANLDWQNAREDRFIAAVALGALHGESHRSRRYFSNRMPRTISTKPDYSVRWWKKHGYSAPRRRVFDILQEIIGYRFESPLPNLRGEVCHIDARNADDAFSDLKGQIGLVITSPPYLDTTNFEEDQWLRLWFLGGPEKPMPKIGSDDRHTQSETYWNFLRDSWKGMLPLVKDGAHIVIRIGGKKLDRSEITSGVEKSLRQGLNNRVRLVEDAESLIVRGQARSFRPGVQTTSAEYDFHYELA